MYVDTSRLAVVNLTLHHRRVSASLHLKTRDPVIVDVVSLKITLKYRKDCASEWVHLIVMYGMV